MPSAVGEVGGVLAAGHIRGNLLGERIRLFDIDIDRLGRESAVQLLCNWLEESARDCRYVVTPNVDHVVKLSRSEEFRQAYQGASLVLADGRPVVAAARLFGVPLPETVPGSDLVPAIFDCVTRTPGRRLSVFLLGAAPGVADRAAAQIAQKWAGVDVVGTYSPPYGFERDDAECHVICERIAASGADLLVIGLGAPKQELWVHRHAGKLPVKLALCVGATIDFIAGEKKRAPTWIQALALEWLHRMLTEPRRLARRYLHDAFVFPILLWKEVGRRSASTDSAVESKAR